MKELLPVMRHRLTCLAWTRTGSDMLGFTQTILALCVVASRHQVVKSRRGINGVVSQVYLLAPRPCHNNHLSIVAL